MRYILTAQPAAMRLALAEAGNPGEVRALAPEVMLARGVGRVSHPVFLRHICPAEVAVPLDGGAGDIARLREAMEPLRQRLSPEMSFSVQTRILPGFQPGYKRFDVNTALAGAAQESGAALDVRHPEQVVSVTLAAGEGYLGLSRPEENLSDWAGGARRYKWEEGQVSRAEFKLLEALETFGVALRDGDSALDLGAAPGGWTRVLRRRGLYVVAVDPAALDARFARDKRVTQVRSTAQAYLRAPGEFDVIVNDMKMDSGESAGLMAQAAGALRAGGVAMLTLKLPDDAGQWAERVGRAQALLAEAYEVAGLRQLFHNRSEVTVCLRARG